MTCGQPLLILDASTPALHAGVLGDHGWLGLCKGGGDALEQPFNLVTDALSAASLTLRDCRGFIICEGPGSLLGLRLTAMVISTWRQLPEFQNTPLWAYRATTAAEQLIRPSLQAGEPYHILVPFRRSVFYTRDHTGAERLTPAEELHTLPGKAFFLPQRNLTQAPAGATPIDYDLLPLAQSLLTDLKSTAPRILTPRDHPEPFSPKPLEYQRWTGQRHS